MKRKMTTVFSIVLIIYGLVFFLPGYLIAGAILLFVVIKKYNLSKVLNILGIIFILMGISLIIYLGTNSPKTLYNLIAILAGLIFLGINRFYNPQNDIPIPSSEVR